MAGEDQEEWFCLQCAQGLVFSCFHFFKMSFAAFSVASS